MREGGHRARPQGPRRSRRQRSGRVRRDRRARQGRARSRLITSRDNERLKLVRKLHDRSWRDKLGLFVVEGEDLVGPDPVDVLVSAGSGAREAVAARLGLPAFGGWGEDVEPALLAEVSTLGHPPRVIAVHRREQLPHGVRPVTLALWRVADPGNVGTLLRAADAFGAGVALSKGCADPTGPKALRAAMGAIWRVPLSEFDEPPRPPQASVRGRASAAWLPTLPATGTRVALVPRGGVPLPELAVDGEVVLVLGAERHGLPHEVLARCDVQVSIPQPGPAESLNVAMAGAIALYGLLSRGSQSGTGAVSS